MSISILRMIYLHRSKIPNSIQPFLLFPTQVLSHGAIIKCPVYQLVLFEENRSQEGDIVISRVFISQIFHLFLCECRFKSKLIIFPSSNSFSNRLNYVVVIIMSLCVGKYSKAQKNINLFIKLFQLCILNFPCLPNLTSDIRG